jgi:hypothetical protein
MKPTTHTCMAQCKANITRSKKQWHDCQGVEYKSPIHPAMLKYRVPRSVLNLLSLPPACLPPSCSMLQGDIQYGGEGCRSLSIKFPSFFSSFHFHFVTAHLCSNYRFISKEVGYGHPILSGGVRVRSAGVKVCLVKGGFIRR